LQLRFEERLSERNRIAQELHDTLLQGFLSASMQIHVAHGRLDSQSPAKPPLGRAIELITRATSEARTVLRGLRSSQTEFRSLEQALSRLRSELDTPETLDLSVVVEGRPQGIAPAVQDEVYWIAREAILNAFRHSRARQVEVEVEYAPHQLRLLIRDNGRGIESAIMKAGRDGHWGLIGMRERSEKLGGNLTVLSSPDTGTQVVIVVPGAVAFPLQHRDLWLQRFWRSKFLRQRITEKEGRSE
jgi:signal transduction histidine kinase